MYKMLEPITDIRDIENNIDYLQCSIEGLHPPNLKNYRFPATYWLRYCYIFDVRDLLSSSYIR